MSSTIKFMKRSAGGRSNNQPPTARDAKTGENNDDIDSIIIMLILCRLPLKTLLRFKQAPTVLLLPEQNPTLKTLLDMVDADGHVRNHRISDHTTDPSLVKCTLTAWNSCSGLVLMNGFIELPLRTIISMYIWNPFSDKYFTLPQTKKYPDYNYLFGFGYCQRSQYKEYKVLLIRSKDFSGNDSPKDVEVYSLATKMKRSIGQAPYPLEAKTRFSFVNGRLHWLVKGNSHQLMICSFNLKHEQSGLVPSPTKLFDPSDNEAIIYWSTLGVFRDCLSVSGCAFGGTVLAPDYEIWVLKDYADGHSWTKEFSLKEPVIDEWWNFFVGFQVITVDSKGGILVLFGGCHLMSYNPRDRNYTYIKRSIGTDVIAHVPSTISPMDLIDLQTSKYIDLVASVKQ